LHYVRTLGQNNDLIMATANMGAYEALLLMLAGDAGGTPVYQMVTNIQTRYSSQSGVITRLRAMRQMGLLEERPGAKRSQVCLVPSYRLMDSLAPVLLSRHGAAQ
jgi:hypothetical protein